MDEDLIKKIEEGNKERLKWLEENIEVIPDPKAVTLYDFKVDWETLSGYFMLKCDDKPCSRAFHFFENGARSFSIAPPLHVSPLGMSSSYAAIEISDKTEGAILRALESTFPKLTPHGLNRETGIETTVHTPLKNRLKPSELARAKLLVTPFFSVTMDCS